MEISDEFVKRFVNAKRVFVLTGAGISAESGVPTFRGGGETTSVWKGMPFDQISSASMVRENLEEVWEWFDYRREALKKCEPNPAHTALVDWERRFEEFVIVTQNVDGLHARAGSENIIELHGNINRSRCEDCRKLYQMRADEIPHTPVECDRCEGRLRPDVILFGEMLPEGAYEEAAEKASDCDLFFVIGTSASVYPAAGLPEIAMHKGAYLVEVNLEATPLTKFCDESLQGKAGEILPKIEPLLR